MKLKIEWKWILPLLLVAISIFANTLGGDFVYDDNRQIVRNPLIQEPALYGKALISDVWAFKGDGTIVASNYWRPTFVAWLIINFRLFGANPFGWHLLNVLLHASVCVLAYLLLRFWNLSTKLAFAITLIFAVHPVRTESVAWISGSPDLVFSLAFLSSLLAATMSTRQDRPRARQNLWFGLSLILYALALGSKEAGFLCFPIYWLILRTPARRPKKGMPGFPVRRFVAYPCVAAAYFLLRWMVIGGLALPREDVVPIGQALLTVPSIFVFYLKQLIFPIQLAANYPLRAVTTIDIAGFFLPVVISLLVVIALWRMARHSSAQKIGLCLFFLPLIPAMNASAFPADQIVHDRYLYLPLFGFLLVIVPYLHSLTQKFAANKAEFLMPAAAALIALPLGWQTFHYNRVWRDEVSIWERTAQVDPSSFVWSQYGAILSKEGKTSEAAIAYENSLRLAPSAIAYMGRARNFLAQKKYAEAESDLLRVMQMTPEKVNAYVLYQSYEALAIVYLEQNRMGDAITSLEESRKRLPIYYAALTEKLAVVLHNQGRKNLAINELEEARSRARVELLPESKAVLYRLGLLYAELNRKDEAKGALNEYLRLTASLKDKFTMAQRAGASQMLRKLD